MSESTITVRPPVPDDAERLFVGFNDPEVMQFIGNGLVQDRSYYQKFVQREMHRHRELGYCLYTVTVDGLVAGFAGLHLWDQPWGPTGEVEMGWRLAREYWGKGVASAAAHLVLTENRTRRLVAMIQLGNVRSEKLAGSLGFTPAGSYQDPAGRGVRCFRLNRS